jgi:cysteine desulfurase
MKGSKVVISEIEPINVLHVVELLQKDGFTVVKIPVDSEGFVNLDWLSEVVDHETAIVSLSLVNNEIGTVQPLKGSG